MRTKLLTSLAPTLLVGAIALGNAGCVKKMILNSTIASTRVGAGAATSRGRCGLPARWCLPGAGRGAHPQP